MRRAFVLLPTLATACGLLTDFDALSNNFPLVEAGIDAAVAPEASSDAPSGPDAAVPQCTIPDAEGAIACEPTRIESLAAGDATIVWIAQRGVIARALDAKTESLVQPRAKGATQSTLIRHADAFVWGFDTGEPSAISSCPVAGCATASALGDPVVHLQKLAGSASGLYAWRNEGNAGVLFSVGSAAFLPKVSENEGEAVTHFTVSDVRAYWRDGSKVKHRCDLPACTNPFSGSAGQAPFYPLSGTKGFVSVSKTDDGLGVLSVRICPDDKVDGLTSCRETADLMLSPNNADSATIWKNEKAVAVANDDFVFTAGIDSAGKIKLGKTEGITNGAYTQLRTLEGAEVTALALNSTDVFVATVTATGQAYLYRFPQK